MLYQQQGLNKLFTGLQSDKERVLMTIEWNTLIAAVEYMNQAGETEFKGKSFTIKKTGKKITINYTEQ